MPEEPSKEIRKLEIRLREEECLLKSYPRMPKTADRKNRAYNVCYQLCTASAPR